MDNAYFVQIIIVNQQVYYFNNDFDIIIFSLSLFFLFRQIGRVYPP